MNFGSSLEIILTYTEFMTYTIISTVDARRQNDHFFVSLFFQILPS